MKLNRLGSSEMQVSEICLGTMTWGEQNSEAEAHAQIEWALANGINFIDTAEMYPIPPAQKTQGSTETIIGNWFAKNKAKRAGIALAFSKSRFFTAATIIGATSTAQLDDLRGYFDLVLPAEVLADLEAVNSMYPSPCAQ